MTESRRALAPDGSQDINHKLDALIVACATEEWCKVALFIARATDAASAVAVPVTGQLIAQRLYALVETGQLAAQGNVRRWRAASVRRPARSSSS